MAQIPMGKPHSKSFILQPSVETFPARVFGDHFRGALAHGQDGKHQIDRDHGGENAGISNAQVLYATDLKLGFYHCQWVGDDGTHLGRTRWMVDSVRDGACVPIEFFV